ncbi:MAG: CocE/NonD family hydrolase [Gemmatimonadales bacterium]
MRHAALFLAAAIACPGVAAQTRADFGVRIPMRDGVQLTADVWRPEDGLRHPVLLVRTPYLRTGLGLVDWGRYFAERGYAFVAQDTRGRGDSDGEFSFFAGDGEDGYDTIEWLARQPWSNGKVGMLGVSYLGTVQWLAAKHRPPHLTCMAPTAPGGRWFDELPYLGGAFAHAWALNWVNGTSGRTLQTPNAAGVDWERVLAHRPLLTADSVMGRVMPLYRSWLEHPVEGPFWRRIELRAEDFAGIAIPTLTTTGWYDADQPGSLMYWRELMANAPKPSEHFLVIGPWGHAETFVGGKTRVGELEFPPSVVIDNKQAHLDFFDWCLKGGGSYDAPRARIFVTGANEWRSYDSYPPKDVVPTPLYLASGGKANGRSGDGRLVWRAEPRSLPDTFTYDPKRPVPAAIEVAAIDRQRLQDRPDVLVYTGESLREPLELIGSVFVDLTVASDALDTDFVAVLSDVHPDGKAVQLGSRIAIKRARYRNGYAREELLEPGRPTPIRIELFDVAHRFPAGHRLRLEVTSSAAPYYNPNQNTGNPVATDVDWKVAHQAVFHDASRPSVITLPLLPRRAPR